MFVKVNKPQAEAEAEAEREVNFKSVSNLKAKFFGNLSRN